MDYKEKLCGKIAIVTGGAQGMGAAISKTLVELGVSVVICDVNIEKAKLTAEKITDGGFKAFAYKLDVTDEDEINALMAWAEGKLGDIGILVNNAGILKPTRFEDISRSEWNKLIDVNLNGVFLCSRAVLNCMKKNNWGRIINMSSSAGRSVSTLGGAHYTASKAGVIGLTRAMAKEVSKFGITVNSVCPGLIDTEMVRHDCSPEKIKYYENSFPIPRLGTPEEVAHLVAFLCFDAYITGAAIDINGGDLML